MNGGRIYVGLALLVVGLCHAAEQNRLPIPTADRQQEALERFERDYRLSRADSAEQKLAAARELLALAEQLRGGSPAHRFAALRTSAELAAEAGDAQLMLQAVDLVAADFQIEAGDARQRMLVRLAGSAHTEPAITSLASAAVPLVEAAAMRRDYIRALELATALESACRRTAGREQLPAAQRLVSRLRSEQSRWVEAEAARAQLERGDDPAAHEVLGLWFAFSESDLASGMQHLVKCADERLAELARRELAPPRSTSARIELADDWYAASATLPEWSRDAVRRRAAFWYHVALLSLHARRERQRIAEQLAGIDGAAEVAAAASSWVASAATVDERVVQAALPSLLQRRDVKLVPLPQQHSEPVALEFLDGAAALPPGGNFLLRDSTEIVYVAGNVSSRPVPVASISLSSSARFRWTYPLPEDVPLEQLANCALLVRDESAEILIGLRVPVTIEPPLLDAFADPNLVRLPLRHLPRRTSVFLELAPLDDFPVAVKLDSARVIGCGQQIELQLSETPGALLRIELLEQGGQELAVRLSTIALYEGRELELTDGRLNTMEKATDDARLAVQQSLRATTNQLAALNKRIVYVEHWRKGDPAHQMTKMNLLRLMRAESLHLRQKIATLQARIGELSRRLEQIPRWRELLESLDQTPISFTIFIPHVPHDLILLTASGGVRSPLNATDR